MEIEDVKSLKREAEARITTVIGEFMDQTGTKVVAVFYRKVDVIGGSSGRGVVELEVTL